jgi:hypothetical protein
MRHIWMAALSGIAITVVGLYAINRDICRGLSPADCDSRVALIAGR